MDVMLDTTQQDKSLKTWGQIKARLKRQTPVIRFYRIPHHLKKHTALSAKENVPIGVEGVGVLVATVGVGEIGRAHV